MIEDDKKEFEGGCPSSCDACAGCGHDHEEGMEDEPIIVLIDEKGNEVKFEILDSIDYKDEEFLITIPYEDSEDGNMEGEVVILKIEEKDGEESYSTVDDEELGLAIFELFKSQNKEEFDFED